MWEMLQSLNRGLFFPSVHQAASPSGSDRKSRRFRLLSSRSGSREESGTEREGPASPRHVPVVEQEAPSSFKEQFVPPELSIWDYFITKVSQREAGLGYGFIVLYSDYIFSTFRLSSPQFVIV